MMPCLICTIRNGYYDCALKLINIGLIEYRCRRKKCRNKPKLQVAKQPVDIASRYLHIAYGLLQPNYQIIQLLLKYYKADQETVDPLLQNLSDSLIRFKLASTDAGPDRYAIIKIATSKTSIIVDAKLFIDTYSNFAQQLLCLPITNVCLYYHKFYIVDEIFNLISQIKAVSLFRNMFFEEYLSLKLLYEKLQLYIGRLIFVSIYKYRPTILSLLYGDLISSIIKIDFSDSS